MTRVHGCSNALTCALPGRAHLHCNTERYPASWNTLPHSLVIVSAACAGLPRRHQSCEQDPCLVQLVYAAGRRAFSTRAAWKGTSHPSVRPGTKVKLPRRRLRMARPEMSGHSRPTQWPCARTKHCRGWQAHQDSGDAGRACLVRELWSHKEPQGRTD